MANSSNPESAAEIWQNTMVKPGAADEISAVLSRIQDGGGSTAELIPLVYVELREAADALMAREREDHSLHPTALVHEVFIRLAEGQPSLGQDRSEFLAVAARAMRNVLVDNARRRGTAKRGLGWRRVTLDGLVREDQTDDVAFLDLDYALRELERVDARQAHIVEMCFFAGMSGQEIADHLGVHRNTVVTELRMARAWLRRAIEQRGSV